MKKFLPLLIFIYSLPLYYTSAYSQTPDTVCAGATSKIYSVDNTAGSTYQWFITGGIQTAGGNSSSITVDWGNTAGLYSLKVLETSSHSCLGDTVILPVRILPLPTAVLSGNTNMCYNDPSPSLTVNFTGLGPWTFIYSDGSASDTISNVNTNPYIFNPGLAPVVPAAGGSPLTTTYSLVSVSGLKSCSGGSVSGTASITINPKPVTSSIHH